MNGYEVLVRGRALAEDASYLSLKAVINHLLLLGRVAEGEHHLARCIVVTAPVEQCDLGLIHVPWSRVQDGLSMASNGWLLGRVAFGQRIVGSVVGDFDLARERVEAMGLDWSRSA